MTQKNINAEEKLRRTAIDRLIWRVSTLAPMPWNSSSLNGAKSVQRIRENLGRAGCRSR